MNIPIALLAAIYMAATPVAPYIRMIPPVTASYETTKPDEEDCALIAQCVWGEARGCDRTQQAAVVWCILNRVDAGYGDIRTVITAPHQFTGWRKSNPVEPELYGLAEDTWNRWMLEKHGVESGRVLPKEYLWFSGDGRVNHFRDAYKGGTRWDWSLESPYEEE